MVYCQMDKLVLMVALGTLSFLLIWGGVQAAQADNLVDNNVDPITMQVGSTNNQLKVKIVSNTAQSQSGDPELDCNTNDGSPATVNLLISPPTGLTYSPNPLTFDYCGNPQKTITFAATIGGTYTITAEVIDTGEGGDSPLDVYHLEPFGTVTVVVIDTTPPETTIDSGPTNPTAHQSATFTFSSNEAGSTFECSLDGAAFTACTSGDEYTGLALGSHTFAVQATDQSGNTDPSPATYAWTIEAVTIGITSVVPGTTIWGEPVDAEGVANLLDLTTLTAELDWGDGTTTPLTIASGSWGPVTHTYDTPSDTPYTLNATLKDGDTVMAFAISTVTVNKHNTALTMSIPISESVTEDTKFLANGSLVDTSAGNVGISGRTIHFVGDNEPADIQTSGVTFEGVMSFESCGSCIADDEVDEVFPDESPGDNVVLHLEVGGKIIFPSSTSLAKVYIQGMGSTPFKYKVMEYPSIPLDCDLNTAVVDEECSSSGSSSAPVPVLKIPSSFVTIDGVIVYNGVKEIMITEVDGDTTGSVAISAVVTESVDTDPTGQHFIGFEDQELPFSPSSPFTVNPGSYFASGVAQDAADDLSLRATFAEDSLYKASESAIVVYDVGVNINGLGANFAASGSGTSVTEFACTGLSDSDNDGICDEFETAPYEIFIDAVSPTVSWTFPAGDQPSTALPDIYYEIDCWAGFCPTQSQLDYIEGRFALENIQLHLMLDQTNLTACNPLHVWSDGDGDPCNDFRSIKKDNYGTNAERTQAGGDLGDNKPLFILKSQAVRYLLFVQNIETVGGGPSGIAEYKGNDAVVAVDSIPAAAADEDETMIGTIMHELGHNLGLLHGGTDDTNCKINYVSVMNYNRQAPHSKMPVPGVSATTSVGWYGDYSHGNILLRNSAGVLIGDGKTVNEGDLDDGNKLTKSGTWKAYDGTTTISSFRLLWGTPTLNTVVQYANTGTKIDWDKDVETADDSNQVHDTNFLSLTIGGNQVPACAEVADVIESVQTGGNDYTTIKNNIAKFNGGSSAYLGVVTSSTDSNGNQFPELNADIVNTFNSLDYQFLGVANPLNNVGFGEPGIATSKKGNTIHVRFNFNDGFGTPITGDNIHLYPVDPKIIMQIAPVTSSEPPEDEDYKTPATSTQGNFADFFTWDGSKWGFQWGTKTLTLGTYAARIIVVQDTGEGVILDHNGDGISFLVTLVKN